MTAFELMDRMSVEEIRLWVEHDRTVIPADSYRFAAMMAKLDWIKGVKRPDAARYLPKRKAARRERSLAEIKLNFDSAAANSARLGNAHVG